jgi:hypothetical protein
MAANWARPADEAVADIAGWLVLGFVTNVRMVKLRSFAVPPNGVRAVRVIRVRESDDSTNARIYRPPATDRGVQAPVLDRRQVKSLTCHRPGSPDGFPVS